MSARIPPTGRDAGSVTGQAAGPISSVDLRSPGRGHLGFAPPDPRRATGVFGALADPTRRALIETLARAGDATATQLSGGFAMSRQAVTKHLAALAEAGLIVAHRVGREQRYQLQPAALDVAQAWMTQVGAAWDDRLAALRDHLVQP